MTVTPQDVQAKIDAGLKNMVEAAALKSYVQKYGKDPAKWPKTTSMGSAAQNFLTARTEAGSLIAPSSAPTAAFIFKEG